MDIRCLLHFYHCVQHNEGNPLCSVWLSSQRYIVGISDGWWPKVILNLSVASLNTYRYAKDFTNASKAVILTLGGVMAAGIAYIATLR